MIKITAKDVVNAKKNAKSAAEKAVATKLENRYVQDKLDKKERRIRAGLAAALTKANKKGKG